MIKKAIRLASLATIDNSILKTAPKILYLPRKEFIGELEINALINGVKRLIGEYHHEKHDLSNYDYLYNLYLTKQRECIQLKNELLFLRENSSSKKV